MRFGTAINRLKRRETGASLIELSLALVIMSGYLVLEVQSKNLEVEQSEARAIGMDLYQYNVGVQKYLSALSVSESPSLGAGTKTGVNWLKGSSCGGLASADYLPCSFLSDGSEKTSQGDLSFTTEIKYSEKTGLSAETTLSELKVNGQSRSDLSGLVALVASGSHVLVNGAALSESAASKVIFCPDVLNMEASFSSLCANAKGKVRSFSSMTTPSSRYLSSDHSNVMNGTIEFKLFDEGDPSSIAPSSTLDIKAIDSNLRQIRNVARIYNLNDEGTNDGSDNLYLGKGNSEGLLATLANNGVIIDANEEVLGEFRVRMDALFDKGLSANGDISTLDGNIVAGNNGSGSGNVLAGGSVTVARELSSGGNLLVGDDARVVGDMEVVDSAEMGGKLRVDSDASFGSDLNVDGISTLRGDTTVGAQLVLSGNEIIQGNAITKGNQYNLSSSSTTGDRLVFGYVYGANGLQSSGDIVAQSGDIQARKFMDLDDVQYSMDPNGVSKLKEVKAQTIKLHKVVTSGESCRAEGDGSIARLADGSAASCVSGKWEKVSLNYTDTPMRCSSQIAVCSRGLGSATHCGVETITGILGEQVTRQTLVSGNIVDGYNRHYSYFTCATNAKFYRTGGYVVYGNASD